MAATADQIARLRRMVAEPTEDTYSDEALADAIERYPLEDARGEGPWVESTTTPGTLEANPDWSPTYDLQQAAADVWEEKAAPYAASFDFSDAGQSFSRSQVYQFMMGRARYHRSRRAPRTITLRPEPLAQGTEQYADGYDSDLHN